MNGWEKLPEYIIEPPPCSKCGGELWTSVASIEANGTTRASPPRLALVTVAKPEPPAEWLGYSNWCPRCEPIESGEWNVWLCVARNRDREWRMWQRPGTVISTREMEAVTHAIQWLGGHLDRIRACRAENGRGPWALERRDGEVWIPWRRDSLSRSGKPLQLRQGRIQHAARPCYACDRELKSGVVWRPVKTSGWCDWRADEMASIVVCSPCYLAARELESVRVVDAGPRRVVVIDGGRSGASP